MGALYLASGTKISTMYGMKEIEFIDEGDMVLTIDPVTKKQVYKKVTDTYIWTTAGLLEYDFGYDIKFTGTPIDMKIGSDVETSWEETEKLIGLNELPEILSFVYSMDVEDTHSFYANGILVHTK